MKASTPDDVVKRISSLFRKALIDNGRLLSAAALRDELGAFRNKQFRSHLDGESGLFELIRENKLIKPLTADTNGEPVQNYLARVVADQASTNADQVISSAILILAHSSLDDIATSACELAVDLDPGEWNKEIPPDRKVNIGDVISRGAEEVIREQRARIKRELKSLSLPNRVAKFFSHVPISIRIRRTNPKTQAFKAHKLLELDKLRHEVVHAQGINSVETTNIGENLEFLHETSLTVLRSLVNRFNLQVDTLQVTGQNRPD